MKISNIPTDYLLIKAFNESELCDFAIIHTTEQWKVKQKERMIAVTPFKNDDSFKWLNYKDESVDFFATPMKIIPKFNNGFQKIICFLLKPMQKN